MEAFLSRLSGLVWGPYVLVPLLAATGLFLTLRLRGLQFRQLGPALWLAFVRRREAGGEGDLSHFQALMTALAATVGTGNIAGVATALAAGGPGALFWMWMTGLLGMATKYAEALLSVHYRVTDERGHMSGGPMYFLSRGLPRRGVGRALGAFFALAAGFAAFGIGNAVQSQEVGSALETSFGFEPIWTRAVLALLVGAVIVGGVRWIGRVAGFFVPVMMVFYAAGALAILAIQAEHVPAALAAVFRGAFGAEALGGGVLGASVSAALRFGVARGIFSNESGLGSAGIAAAAAATREPVRQALVSMTQTFIDTLVLCTLTGLVILATVQADLSAAGAAETTARWGGVSGAEMTTLAFRASLPGGAGGTIVSVGLAFFAFSTLLGWSYYGEKCLQYLLGSKVVPLYRAAFAAVVFLGPLVFGPTIWELADVMNGLMAFPNLVGLLALSGVVARETRVWLARPRVG